MRGAAWAVPAELNGYPGPIHVRNTHLKYHLTTATLLSPEQICCYGELRGYGQGASTYRSGARANA
jgi:hypothetical protein